MGKRFAAASGMFLAAAAIAGAPVTHADEPGEAGAPTQPSTQTPPTASLTGAVSPADDGAANPAAADAANPPGTGPANPANTGAAPPADAGPASPGDDGTAAPVAPPNPMASMGSSIGSSMAMMGPMMGAYVPIMAAPMVLSAMGVGGAADATDPSATAEAVLPGAAEAVGPGIDPDLAAILGAAPDLAADASQDGLEHAGNATSAGLSLIPF